MPLAEADRRLLQSLSVRLRNVCGGQDIVSEGDQTSEFNLITSGFACRYKLLKSGTRQILGFLISASYVISAHYWWAEWITLLGHLVRAK